MGRSFSAAVVGGRVRRALHPNSCRPLGWVRFRHTLQDRVAAHVERCVVCQALGDALNDPSVGELRSDEQARILERVHAGANASTRIRSANRLWQFAGAAAAVVLLIAGTVLVWQSRRAAPAPTTPQVAAKVPSLPRRRSFSLKSLRFGHPTRAISCGAGRENPHSPTISLERSRLCARTISRRQKAGCRRWSVVNREARRPSSIWA